MDLADARDGLSTDRVCGGDRASSVWDLRRIPDRVRHGERQGHRRVSAAPSAQHAPDPARCVELLVAVSVCSYCPVQCNVDTRYRVERAQSLL